MNQDQNQPLEEDANRDHLAGSGPIERSESGAEPAGADVAITPNSNAKMNFMTNDSWRCLVACPESAVRRYGRKPGLWSQWATSVPIPGSSLGPSGVLECDFGAPGGFCG